MNGVYNFIRSRPLRMIVNDDSLLIFMNGGLAPALSPIQDVPARHTIITIDRGDVDQPIGRGFKNAPTHASTAVAMVVFGFPFPLAVPA